MSEVIEIRDLFRIHSTEEGDAAALQGLSLTVREGEIVVVLGPSGSGKTTLLRILAGLDRPSAGTVRVFGADLGKLPRRELASYRSRTLGYADQHYSRALEPELTARQLVALQLALTGMPREERLRHADDLLERVGLRAKRDARPHQLSGGEQQRVAVCAALAHRPRVFLADEPTGELDSANAALVYEAIGHLARVHRCTTVVVSHDPESAEIADRVVRIRDGRVSGESTRDAGRDEAIVVGRGGWLRVPEELLRRAGIGERAPPAPRRRSPSPSPPRPSPSAPLPGPPPRCARSRGRTVAARPPSPPFTTSTRPSPPAASRSSPARPAPGRRRSSPCWPRSTCPTRARCSSSAPTSAASTAAPAPSSAATTSHSSASSRAWSPS